MKTAVEWLFDNLDLSGGGEAIETLNKAKEMEKKEKLKYQLFMGKVSEIIGDKKTFELLKECQETIKSE